MPERCPVAWCDGTNHHLYGCGTVDHHRKVGSLDYAVQDGELHVTVGVSVTTDPAGAERRPTVDVDWEYREDKAVCLTDGLRFSPAKAAALAPLLAEAARLLAGGQEAAA